MNLLYCCRYLILEIDVLRYNIRFVVLIGNFWRFRRYVLLPLGSMDRERSEAFGVGWWNKSVGNYIISGLPMCNQ